MANQDRTDALLLFVEMQGPTYKVLYMLLTAGKGLARDAVDNDAQTCAEAEASLALPGWCMDEVYVRQTDSSSIH